MKTDAERLRALAHRLDVRFAAPSLEGYGLVDGLIAAADLLEGKHGSLVHPDITPATDAFQEKIPLRDYEGVMTTFDVKPGDTIAFLEDGSILGPVRLDTAVGSDGAFIVTAKMQAKIVGASDEEIKACAHEHLSRMLCNQVDMTHPLYCPICDGHCSNVRHVR